MPSVPLYNGASTLNTILDPQRLSQGTRNAPGIIELAKAVNMSIDDRGLVTLRRGDALLKVGGFHSLFCDGGDCFVVQELVDYAVILRVTSLAPIITETVVSGLSQGLRTEFKQVNEDTFWSNGVQCGYVRAGVNHAWPAGSYRGPDADVDFLTSPPIPNHMAFIKGGKCAVAVGNAVFLNHEPFQYGLFAPALGYIGFDGDVSMLCEVTGGFYASDTKRTWFFRKVDGGWYNYRQELAYTAPALEWSLSPEVIMLRDIGYDLPGSGRVWASTDGICVGTDDGQVFCRTKDAVAYPSGYTSGACLVSDFTVIHTAS